METEKSLRFCLAYIYIHSMKRRLNLVPRSCRATVTDRGRFRYETNAARDFTKRLYSTNYLSPEGWEGVFAVCRMILAVSQWNLPDPLRRLRFPIIESQFSLVPHLYTLLLTIYRRRAERGCLPFAGWFWLCHNEIYLILSEGSDSQLLKVNFL